MTAKKDFERLPTSVKPVNYNIRLHPDLEKFTFTGVEVIDVEVRRLGHVTGHEPISDHYFLIRSFLW